MSIADELQAASDELVASWKAQDAPAEVPEEVPADAARLRHLLEQGGRAVVTVRSKRTGEHVGVVLVVKARKPDGKGFLGRNSKAGRVGLADGHVVFANDPAMSWPDDAIGSFMLDTGEWRPRPGADPKRVWAADHLLRAALADYDIGRHADLFIATRCSVCGKGLEHPESVEDGRGPECRRQRNRGKRSTHALRR